MLLNIYYLIKKKNTNFKSIIYFMIPMIIYFLYYYYMKTNSADIAFSITTYPREYAYKYLVSLMHHMHSQFIDCIPFAFLSVVLLGCILKNIINKKINYLDKIILFGIFIIGNILFLIVCYIFIFGDEARIAASYIRYLTRIYILEIAFLCYLLKKV